MKKNGLLVLLGLLISVASVAQSTLTGTVKDEKGEALVGVNCYIKALQKGVVTDFDGQFSIQNIPTETQLLSISAIGYQTQEISVKDFTEKLAIVLQESAVITEEVIVKANRYGKKTPMTYSNISNDLINKNQTGKEITSLLALSPSVMFTSESGTAYGYSHIKVRGTDATRVNVTIDGVPLNDPESHGVFWSNMPDFVSSVDNVQIQRGVGSSSNGAASFGASVNFQTDQIQKEAFADIDLTTGSFGTYSRSFKAGTGLIDNQFAFNVRYSEVESDGFVDRAFIDHKALMFTGAYVSENTIVKAKIMLGDQRTGISWWGNPNYKEDRTFNPAGGYEDPDGTQRFYDGQTDNYKQDHYNLNILHNISENITLNVTPYIVKGAGYFEQYKEDENLTDYNPNYKGEVKESDLIRQKHLDNILYGVNSNLNFDLGKLNLVYGLGGNYYDGDHFGYVKWIANSSKDADGSGFWDSPKGASQPIEYKYYMNVGEKTDANTFLKASYDLNEQFNVYADLQYRYINYEISGKADDQKVLAYDKNFDFMNPKLGLNYKLDASNRFYTSFAVANREPARADIEEASKEGGKQFPTHETLYNYELGYSYTSSKIVVNANLFLMDYKDQLVNTGAKNSTGNDLMTNVESSFRRGIELATKIKPINELSIDLNFTYMQSTIQDYAQFVSNDINPKKPELKQYGDVATAYAPEILSNAILTYAPVEELNLIFTAKYIGDQYFDNTESSDRQIAGYHTEDFTLSYNLKQINLGAVTLYATVNNLFDAEYETHASGGFSIKKGAESTWAYYYPQAGRNFMFRTSIMF